MSHKKSKNKNRNLNVEFAEDENLEPRLRPSQTGSVSQNTSKPVSKHKKSKKKDK